MILKMLDPDLGFRFEWHPEQRAIYAVHHATGLRHEQIAGNILSEQAADLAVRMWCRGYRSRKRELERKPNVGHHHLFCEMGKVGADMPRPTTTQLEQPWRDTVEA